MVVKIRNDENVTSWVHRTQLRYIPDRPDHLQNRSNAPLMIPVPVMLQPPSKITQPPSGGRRTRAVGFEARRRSKIPVLSEIEKNKTSFIQAKTVNPVNNTTNTQPAIPTSRSLRRVTKSSAHTSQNRVNRVQPEQTTKTAKRYPERIRRPPSKFKDYVKH